MSNHNFNIVQQVIYTFEDRTKVPVFTGNHSKAVVLRDNGSKAAVSMENSMAAVSKHLYLFKEGTVTSIHFISLLERPKAIVSKDITHLECFFILEAFSFFIFFLFLEVDSFSVEQVHFFAVPVSCKSFSGDLLLSCLPAY